MNNNLEKLEYFQILENLSKHCVTFLGKKKAYNLRPNNSRENVEKLLQETSEATNLVTRNSAPSFYEIKDITTELKILEGSGVLSCASLLELAKIFKLSYELKDYLNRDFLDLNDYPILSNLFDGLYSNKNVVETIFSCIIDETTLDDKASSNLQKIRKQQRNIEQDIRKQLNSMIHSSKYSKYIQESIITQRNRRFVIPIKEEYRSMVKGFVHDISNAGSTVFIEPISVFELNNELASLKVEEEIEIEKILQKLTALFYPYIKELRKDLELIGELDFIFAKAKFSKVLHAITPKINNKKEFSLKNARHPLIDQNVVVPISVELGKDFSTLLITGPNTGGKTVVLKTVGLLTLMALSGLNIPADENSSIYVFDHVFADIGDDQSISESLSTFSSHMVNIVNILKNATSNSLILVDELGSGTDPVEGANIAISILDYFFKKSCLTIATTHYQELKHYALVTDGFENASVEFDLKTLKPTYRLLIGIPGKSNAFEISKNLGLDNSIIEKAKSLMSSEQVNLEDLLKSIYDNKSSIEKEKQEIDEKLNNIDLLEKELLAKKEEFENKKKELLQKAKIQARDILLDAKEEANEIIHELNKLSSQDIKTSENLRNKLNKSIKDLSSFNPETASKNANSSTFKKEEIKPNMEVFVRSLSQNATVLSRVSKSDEVQVQIGLIKTSVPISDLEKVTEKQTKLASTSNYPSISKSKSVKSEVNVIGYNVEDAVFVVDKFLDDCALAKLKTARIIHGKGTGKLKNGIHQFLKTNPHVKSFRMGTYGEGEMGVTVVELK